MKAKIVFEDGSEGSFIKDEHLTQSQPISIMNKNGKFNICLLNLGKNEITSGKELLKRDCEKIDVITVRNSYYEFDWDDTISNPERKGFKCTLPDGKKEVFYFRGSDSDELSTLFSEEDDVDYFEQAYLLYGIFKEDAYYIITHNDKTKSLVHKNLRGVDEEDKLIYISKHAHDIKNRALGKIQIIREPHGKNILSYQYDITTKKITSKRYKKFKGKIFETDKQKNKPTGGSGSGENQPS